MVRCIGGFKGGDASLCLSALFHFHAKKCPKIGWCSYRLGSMPLVWEILDPPLTVHRHLMRLWRSHSLSSITERLTHIWLRNHCFVSVSTMCPQCALTLKANLMNYWICTMMWIHWSSNQFILLDVFVDKWFGINFEFWLDFVVQW